MGLSATFPAVLLPVHGLFAICLRCLNLLYDYVTFSSNESTAGAFFFHGVTVP